MYIAANLPALYGQFNEIQKDNYPFRKMFGEYLETFSRLGIAMGMDAGKLVGAIEDMLFEGRRLPDMERGTEPVKFRFPLENESVETYFKSNNMSNKAIILLVIRLTIRLSAEYGTSLPRLTHMLEKLMPAGATHVDNVDNSVDNTGRKQPKVRIVKAPQKKPALKEDMPKGAGSPALPETAAPGRLGAGLLSPAQEAGAAADQVSEKLSELVEKAGQLIGGQKGEDGMAQAVGSPEGKEEGIQVVETNPLLASFFS